MPPGNIHHLNRSPVLRVVAPAFPPRRAPSFRSHDGYVWIGRARLTPEAVSDLLAIFEREAHATGDWTLFDDLQAARDGLSNPPPEAA